MGLWEVSYSIILIICGYEYSRRERERAADGDHYGIAEESPPTIQVTQPCASTGGESHGSGTETTRPLRSNETVRNPSSVDAEGPMERRIPAGASRNRICVRCLNAMIRVRRLAECRNEQEEAYYSDSRF